MCGSGLPVYFRQVRHSFRTLVIQARAKAQTATLVAVMAMAAVERAVSRVWQSVGRSGMAVS